MVSLRIACTVLILFFSRICFAQPWLERSDWKVFFNEADVSGTIAVLDERTNQAFVFNKTRAKVRYIPASTFKLPHTLFALDAGVINDEFELIKWDKKERPISSWNRDQTLRSAMRSSTVWVYQDFARQLGEQQELKYLRKINYGNADASGGIDQFWLEGGLRVSASEQISFLQQLHRNKLPFKVEHQRLLKDLMIIDAGKDFILRAKSGWASSATPQLGWFVGWVERPEGAVFFALNIDMPKKADDIPKREAIVRKVLSDLKALPAK
jgi:beta-lactamase class D